MKILKLTEGGKKEVYHLTKFKRTAHSTCYNQIVRVVPGQKVEEGDLLVDGPASRRWRTWTWDEI